MQSMTIEQRDTALEYLRTNRLESTRENWQRAMQFAMGSDAIQFSRERDEAESLAKRELSREQCDEVQRLMREKAMSWDAAKVAVLQRDDAVSGLSRREQVLAERMHADGDDWSTAIQFARRIVRADDAPVRIVQGSKPKRHTKAELTDFARRMMQPRRRPQIGERYERPVKYSRHSGERIRMHAISDDMD